MNGVYIKRPYSVTLKDYRVTVNGVLYEPASEEHAGRVAEFTDSERLKEWENLVSTLGTDSLVIRSINNGGLTGITSRGYTPTLVSDITALVKSNKSTQQKREALAKLLDTYPEHAILNDILKNWK